MKPLFSLIILLTIHVTTWSQYPPYFSYTIESGAPSNEIYSIIQDRDGYIWIGCDAGVYRFNGVDYESFSSKQLTARSATGLVQSPSGKIYGYNFNNQIFYIDKGKLHVLADLKISVNGLASDKKGGIWVSAMEGCFIINDLNLKWTKRESKHHLTDIHGRSFTSNIRSDAEGQIHYHNTEKVIVTNKSKDKAYFVDSYFFNSPMVLPRSSKINWIFSLTDGIVYQKQNEKWVKNANRALLDLLKDRKVNSVVEMEKELWINTHTGTIRFNALNGQVELFYPKIAFSDCLKDREGNYWFSTLHHGLLKFTSLTIRAWNRQSGAFEYEQFSHISGSLNHVFFANSGGELTIYNKANKKINRVKHEPQADIGMLYYDKIDNCTYFNKIGFIYKLNDLGEISLINPNARAMKSMLHVENGYMLLSSQGLYFTKKITEPLTLENQLSEEWFRDVATSPFSEDLYLACNKGLAKIQKIGDGYVLSNFILKGKQILSVCSSPNNKLIYFLTYDGIVHTLDKNGKIETFFQPENGMRSTQIRYHEGAIYLATNKGILKIDLRTKKRKLLTSFDGLSSNNIRFISFENDTIWAATGKGIVLIPLKAFERIQIRGKILGKGILVNGKAYDGANSLKYTDVLTILTDGLSYKSNSDFQFAYRIVGHTEEWILIPGSAGKVEIPGLPTGNISVELKMIDHNGHDSLNTLSFHFHVIPPFWQRWWFYVLIIGLVGLTAFLFFKRREAILKNKQMRELKNLRLENELRLTQQNALKAQMNPHFLFNVLNSIKGYIYENDKKNAAKYLSDFSNLVRKVLEMSSLPKVTLAQEIEVLTLYIDLEAMLLDADFTYTIHLDDQVDPTFVHIPALLIQPYVENVFKHGLRHKIGEKHLNIDISYNSEDEVLTILVIDNGIGRSAAEMLNTKNRGEHQSFASNAMERRLELLNYEKKGIVGVEIKDNYDQDHKPTGTTVIIRIHV